MSHVVRVLIAAVFVSALTPFASADSAHSNVLTDGKQPDDRRLLPPKDLNGYFPFQVPESRDAWNKRAAELRQRVLVATGLWPMPEKTPLNPTIHGRVQRDGFTVEKVYFESLPDHYVTGLLFRPQGKAGPRPGVLCPHGHGGRLQDYGEKRLKEYIAAGAEKFEKSGRYPKLARCAQLARMGCVVFIFDMLGYADSVQVSYQLAHRFAKQRPEFESPENWGLFSTQAELRMQSIMGLQTWNSVRALDFLAGLPDVDDKRLGVTGGSGGGTQTILLGAIDPRPVVAFPQGMVSTSMQGGCTCENCSLLRIGTGNVELAALFAPRPQAMTAANDWTKEMMTKGYPQLQQLYKMLGAGDKVLCKPYLHFPHNYNYVTRADMYAWFNQYLGLNLSEPIVEQDYEPLTAAEWTVWNDEHPQPKTDASYERKLTSYLDEQAARQLAALEGDEYRRVAGGAVETIIGRTVPAASEIQRQKIDKQDRGDWLEFKDLLRLTSQGEELPVVSFFPKSTVWNGSVVIWVDGGGKSAMFEADGRPVAAIRELLAKGQSVIGADLLYQGEFLGGKPFSETPVVKNTRQFAGYTFTYNHTVFASRVHDILTLLSFVRSYPEAPKRISLVGLNGAGPLAAAARAIAGQAIERALVDTQGFRFTSLTTYRDPNFLPGIVKYGDVPGLLALSAPHSLGIVGEKSVPSVVTKAYRGSTGRAELVESTSPVDLVGFLTAD